MEDDQLLTATDWEAADDLIDSVGRPFGIYVFDGSGCRAMDLAGGAYALIDFDDNRFRVGLYGLPDDRDGDPNHPDLIGGEGEYMLTCPFVWPAQRHACEVWLGQLLSLLSRMAGRTVPATI